MVQLMRFVLLVLLGYSFNLNADVSLNGALLSDYIYRGNTQSDGEYTLQLGADYSHTSGLYAGAMGSSITLGDLSSAEFAELDNQGDLRRTNIGRNGDASYEIRGYAGYALSLGQWFFDLGYQAQRYPGVESDSEDVFDEDVNEVYVGLGYRFLSLEHFEDIDDDDQYTRLGADFALTKSIDLSLGIGLTNPTDGANVSDYLLGFDFDFSNFILELNYTATDSSDPAGNGAFAFGVRKEY